MSYETQGRQEHGWFGHGTAPASSTDPKQDGSADALFDPANQTARFEAIARAAVASLPQAMRGRSAASFDQKRLGQFTTLMTNLASGKASDVAVSDATLGKLRQAAELAGKATTQKELAQASSLVADAMQDVGLDRWAGVLANATTDAKTTNPVGYVDPDPKQWTNDKEPKSVGNGECVALVQARNGANAPRTSEWKQGDKVQGNTSLKPGTVIATFDQNGRYTNSAQSHAAIYLGQDENGIRVIDQWNNRNPKTGDIESQQVPHERTLPFGRPGVNGGDDYYVVK